VPIAGLLEGLVVDGPSVGEKLGDRVGEKLGDRVGADVGDLLGRILGSGAWPVGSPVGDNVSPEGLGETVGTGGKVGDPLG